MSEEKPKRRLLNRLPNPLDYSVLGGLLKQERESAEYLASLKGLAETATPESVVKAIETLHRYATILSPLRAVDPNQTFDGFDLAVIYVQLVIRDQYAMKFSPSLEHAKLLDSLQSDPLHSTIGETYALRNIPHHNTTRVLDILCAMLDAQMEYRGTEHSRAVEMHMWISNDRMIWRLMQVWLWRGRTYRGMTQPMGQGDEWLLTKLRDAQRDPDAINRDYFNMWTASDENRAIPADVLARATCPEIPNKDKP
jgi:hypothetical protein